MSQDVKASTTDALRLQQHRASLERQAAAEVKEIEDKKKDDVERAMTANEDLKKNLETAYQVQFSQEAENLEATLARMRLSHQQQISQEKQSEESEFNKLRANHLERVEKYKKQSEKELNDLRKNLQDSSQRLHAQAKKSQRTNTGNQEG